MAEYIDKDKLLDELKENAKHHAENSREEELLLSDRNIVCAQPAADVAPTQPARWIVNKERTEMVCSHCHTRYRNMVDEIEAFSTAFRGYYYCSYCGSRTEEIEYR